MRLGLGRSGRCPRRAAHLLGGLGHISSFSEAAQPGSRGWRHARPGISAVKWPGLPDPLLARSGVTRKQALAAASSPRCPVHQGGPPGVSTRGLAAQTEPNEDGWYQGSERRQRAPSQTTIEFPRDSVWQGGDPDRCPEVSGQRLLLMEAQMDINVYRPRKHFSAESGLLSTAPDPGV